MTETELVPTTQPAVIHEPIPMPPSTLEVLTRSELDTMILSARRFPRSLALFRQNAMAMIREDVETAEACYYTLARKKADGTTATIDGPTIRLAEIVKSAWGNIASGGRLLAVRDHEVVGQGFAHDLQTNTYDRREVTRRITRADGGRYSDDMITVTSNAAIAIAERNAIFNVIPRALIDPLWRYAKKVVAGNIKTLGEARKRALAEAEGMKIPAARVYAALGRAGLDDLTVEDLADLKGMLNSVRDGHAGIDEAFPPPPAAEGAGPAPSASAALTERLRRRRRGEKAGEAPAASASPGPTTPPKEPPDGAA